MNFEEWYDKNHASSEINECEFYFNKGAKAGWDVCKNEVLKILNDKNNRIVYESYNGFGYNHISPSVVDKIKEL